MVAIEARDLPKIPTDIFRREPPALHASLPDGWHAEQTGVRAGNRFIKLDEARLPRLTGIMGTVNMIQKGKAEFMRPAPAPTQGQQEQAGALVVKTLAELAMLGVGAAATKKGRGKNTLLFLGGLGLLGTGGAGLAMDLSGCTPAEATPPAIVTEAPATAKPIETSTPSLGNEVIPGTPSLVPETPAPVGSMYPTEVSGMTDPKVYSYGGVEGRANMNEYTRAMFDRYIAEMARTGLLTGTNVEQLYQSFDNQGFDFKLFTTQSGQAWLIQTPDSGYYAPKTLEGQMFRDLQLSYDYLFQNGAAVPVGTDNFDLQKFSANRVGFVGAWPVLVSVDAQNVPVSWVNMEQGGATNPIVLASATATPETVATTVPDSRVELAVGGETFRVTTDVLYTEVATNLNIDPSKAQKIGELLVYSDVSGRLIWNEHMAAWTPEFATSVDYKNPETSPHVPLDAYNDGSKPGDPVYIPSSSTLSDLLYLAEHPDLIKEESAAYPHYRVALFGNDSAMIGYQIVLTGPNQYLLTGEDTTQLSNKKDLPFGFFGVQQTSDAQGDTIYVVKKANWNPAGDMVSLPTNHGFDKAAYEKWFENQLIMGYIASDPQITAGELVPLFLSPAGQFQETNPNRFVFETQPANPNVASMVHADAINMFSPDVRDDISSLYSQIGKPFDANTSPGSYLIGSLPSDLSNMILYTGVHSFY